MRGQHQGRLASRFLVVALATAAIALPSAVDAGTTPASKFTATGLSPSSIEKAAKSASGRLATTDPSLLGRTDATPINVVVKLDYDATASYKGDIEGLEATSPIVTGRELTGKSGAERAYEGYTAQLDKTFRNNLAAAVPEAQAGDSLQRVYGGVAVTVPANQVSTILGIPGVAAVQADQLNKPDDTIESPEFIGAPTVWAQTGGQSLAGQGVIFGDIDTGLWPEHPMMADNPALGTPPPAPSGVARECNYGDNPLTPAVDVFACNSKVIGGAPFIDTYNTLIGGEVFPDSARDSNGHGTHTTTTAAGDPVDTAPIFGIDRGPASGVAPGAWVIEYKVCGLQGCFSSDSAAAVAQAILDGVNVINFSISGGGQPFSDVVELAFLDAYNAGITVAASAGNSGPAAGTTDHRGPWVITVAASTQSREFQSTLTVSSGADTATFVGTSLTTGIPDATPIILAENIPGYDSGCSTPLAAGSATGEIVACKRGGIGRIQKGANVQAGGAVAMILYNLPLADTESDNHFLPAIHLADGTEFLAFMTAHPDATGSFTDGVKAEGQGDVMAAFSSRGPGGQFLKPDITAPGVQILAGNTPVPDEVAGGAKGQYYQAIAGTSMSSPHIAGSALLMKALHPDWRPGEIKSALMTTATTDVVKQDLVTPADPFDFGAGRVDLTQAGSAAIVFEDTAQRMFNLGQSGVTALDLNLPSINVPTMPGTVTVTRTATNVTNSDYRFQASTVSPAGSTIKITPAAGRIRPGKSQTFKVTITSSAATGQYFGQINLTSKNSPALHLPVAFFNKQGDVTLAQSCDPTTIRVRGSTTCAVTAQNNGDGDATVSITSKVSSKLEITGASGALVNRKKTTAQTAPVVLTAPADGIPAIAPGVTPGEDPTGCKCGYLDLGLFGITPIAVGDESVTNFNVPPFIFGGNTYTRLGVDSNGYIVVGGGTAADNSFAPQTFPDPAAPNGVLAAYWTDLNDGGVPSVSVGSLADSVSGNSWLIVQWNTHVFGNSTAAGSRRMQVWIGINGVEDISYGYDTNSVGVDAPPGTGLTVGAESAKGTAGAQIVGPPASSYVITSTPGTPGGSTAVTLSLRGKDDGTGKLTSSMVTNVIAGTTIVSTSIKITKH
ncbi:MAG TPA: S8 family serine peptidase [Ilumatobacteraceae bacterium]|nr:S8 family serine peptidase [Ilumatobacteraceae bacterium]